MRHEFVFPVRQITGNTKNRKQEGKQERPSFRPATRHKSEYCVIRY